MRALSVSGTRAPGARQPQARDSRGRRVSPPRIVTPDEARAAIPRLRPLLATLREAYHAWRFAREQLDELVRLHGEAVLDQDLPDSADARRLRDDLTHLTSRVDAILAQVDELGAEVKDPIMGLVDFYAKRGDETVFLCYRDDETTLDHWHPLSTGFAGRRPLAEF